MFSKYIYGAIVLAVISAIMFAYNKGASGKAELENQLQQTGALLNDAYEKLDKQKAKGIQEYIDAINTENNNTSTIYDLTTGY